MGVEGVIGEAYKRREKGEFLIKFFVRLLLTCSHTEFGNFFLRTSLGSRSSAFKLSTE